MGSFRGPAKSRAAEAKASSTTSSLPGIVIVRGREKRAISATEIFGCTASFFLARGERRASSAFTSGALGVCSARALFLRLLTVCDPVVCLGCYPSAVLFRHRHPAEKTPASFFTSEMGGFLSTIFSSLFGRKEVRVLILGLDNAGKTTILCASCCGNNCVSKNVLLKNGPRKQSKPVLCGLGRCTRRSAPRPLPPARPSPSARVTPPPRLAFLHPSFPPPPFLTLIRRPAAG